MRSPHRFIRPAACVRRRGRGVICDFVAVGYNLLRVFNQLDDRHILRVATTDLASASKAYPPSKPNKGYLVICKI